MASIGINFSIMSHHGSTDRGREAEVSPQELEEDGKNGHDVHCQQRNQVHNRMYHSVRSESSVPNHPFNGVFGESDASMSYPFNATAVTRHSTFGMSEHDPSSELLGSGLNFENRGYSAVEAACPPPSSALSNDNTSFELENYEQLTEDLGLNPLIDMNEPTGDFLLTHSFDENKDSLIDPQRIHHSRENDVSDGTRYDEDMDRKPAAVDSRLFQQQNQQHFYPNQQSMYPTQASNNAISFDRTIDRSLRDQATIEKKVDERKSPPVASVARGSDRSTHNKGKVNSNLKAPPVASFPARGNRRSSRITTQTIKSKVSPKKAHSKLVNSARPKTRADSKMKALGPPKRTSTLIIRPTKKQLTEARTRRKTEALLTWFKRLQELVEFKDDNGHANVPQQYAKNHSLGIWVNKQRMEKKAKDAGKHSSLTDDKIQLLEEAGFVWAKRKGQVAWEEKFAEVQRYLLKNGNCNVPTKNRSNRALGRWVSTQRSNYKKFKNGESPKHPRMDRQELERRIRRLDGIGFAWSLLPGDTKAEVDGNNDEDSSDDETDSTPPPVNNEGEDENDEEKDDGGDTTEGSAET